MRAADPCESSDPPRSLRLGVAVQAALLLATGLLAFTPPAHGLMLLVPLGPGGAGSVEALIDASGATRVAIGPLPGSFYVEGARARLLPAAMARGVLLFSGRPRLCGPFPEASTS
ncbi:hypothetical protein FHS95_001391 [Sphingomonas naasensis]|uniref:Uncharacterized protein n=1 Tax=Sphingomonas naasensis TaxID=1344951 RepID=A0A4S1WB24_9SPHN|nr:hypothetical protein [Sphingomonas naasensis]NIJ19722.1 hypothetical protein [Sphingomonas naasensis]TGX40134.1 hypothetical protein E5A74_16335 [Sphingomonas naasensis]